jgi:hypothetical protein
MAMDMIGPANRRAQDGKRYLLSSFQIINGAVFPQELQRSRRFCSGIALFFGSFGHGIMVMNTWILKLYRTESGQQSAAASSSE